MRKRYAFAREVDFLTRGRTRNTASTIKVRRGANTLFLEGRNEDNYGVGKSATRKCRAEGIFKTPKVRPFYNGGRIPKNYHVSKIARGRKASDVGASRTTLWKGSATQKRVGGGTKELITTMMPKEDLEEAEKEVLLKKKIYKAG